MNNFINIKIIVTILSFCMLWQQNGFSQAENLVLNPSFEDYDKCPENYTYTDKSHKLIPHWTYPTLTTPDYFNKCSSGVVKIPSNFAGVSQPKSGDAYMGSILSGSEKNYREYFQGELETPLEKDKKYCVTFYYKLASYSKFAVDQLSLYFCEEKISNEGKTHLSVKPQINNIEGLFLDNTKEWKQLCRVYTAKGNEKFFTVGNFKNYDNTNYVVTDKSIVNKKDKAYAYYYFDEFVIRELIDCDICPCLQHGLETVIIDSGYTGGVDPVTGEIDKIINDGKITIGISGGTPPYNIEWSNNTSGTKLTNLPAGTYTYKVTDKNNCISSGTIVFTEPVIPEDPFTESLKNIEEGATIVLENIFFETGKTSLLPISYTELDRVYNFMQMFEIKEIEISGHTDSEGPEEFNQKLSEGRAKAVVDYLVEKGIEDVRLSYIGYGENKPIDTNNTDIGRAQNRRVEFKLKKK
ncbi:MAG: OmpA family protein [Bacteroidales bacterium]|nr:OmpA family protein [Bacteroidales bacterium]